jgi:hypothetical protein
MNKFAIIKTAYTAETTPKKFKKNKGIAGQSSNYRKATIEDLDQGLLKFLSDEGIEVEHYLKAFNAYLKDKFSKKKRK